MIEAGGPAPLVARQEKAQNIILFSTDRSHIKSHELENAIMDDIALKVAVATRLGGGLRPGRGR